MKDSAKDSIRELGSARAARLRSAYDSLKQRSLRAVGAHSSRDDMAVLGTDGPLRVRYFSAWALKPEEALPERECPLQVAVRRVLRLCRVCTLAQCGSRVS